MTDKLSTPNDITEIAPDKGDILVQKETVQQGTVSSLEEELSKSPLTPDQRIDQLTAEVRNLTNGLNQLLELSKILMKNQIESSSVLVPFIQLTTNSLHDIVETQSHDTQILNVLAQSEKDRVLSKNLMSQLQNYSFGNYKGKECFSLQHNILSLQNINARDGSGYTLLEYAVEIENQSLVSFLLQFPEIEVSNSILENASGYISRLLQNHLSNKKK